MTHLTFNLSYYFNLIIILDNGYWNSFNIYIVKHFCLFVCLRYGIFFISESTGKKTKGGSGWGVVSINWDLISVEKQETPGSMDQLICTKDWKPIGHSSSKSIPFEICFESNQICLSKIQIIEKFWESCQHVGCLQISFQNIRCDLMKVTFLSIWGLFCNPNSSWFKAHI